MDRRMRQPLSCHTPDGLRARINEVYRKDERDLIALLLAQAHLTPEQVSAIQNQSSQWIHHLRTDHPATADVDRFLTQYPLSSKEGFALMCLAEALLRIPDKPTQRRLIKDKMRGMDWASHRGQSPSFWVNTATWALLLTGRVLAPGYTQPRVFEALYRVIGHSRDELIRIAMQQAIQQVSRQFIMGQTINQAMLRAEKKEKQGYRYSYDCLGEAALTRQDAQRYFTAYQHAIESLGRKHHDTESIYERPGISVKLSALHPRYYESHRAQVMAELIPRVLTLAHAACKYQIGLTLDAEESDRLDLSLDIFEQIFHDESLADWQGLGLAVQAYQKRAFFVIDWIAALARTGKRRIMVRLVKGAYWDSEIKKAQMHGLSDYPVFTRKAFTDVSFQACVKKLFTLTDVIYPQFATHNAYSVAMIMQLAGAYRDFEFQCLYGMGTDLYAQVVPVDTLGIACRIYAPIGSYEHLLPYLVRRLLENGANASFVHRIMDPHIEISTLVIDPVEAAANCLLEPTWPIVLPEALFMPQRRNAKGLDLSDRAVIASLQGYYENRVYSSWEAKPSSEGYVTQSPKHPVRSPQCPEKIIGWVWHARPEDVDRALACAVHAQDDWAGTDVHLRAACLNKLADLLYENRLEIWALLREEAGKTWPDAVSEWREAIDFCNYYASQAIEWMAKPRNLKGYTGESNQLSLVPRGIAVCISPWNFPLAIFIGQVSAALAVGNCVLAKPAEATPLIAARAVTWMHQAGIPQGAIQLLTGCGKAIGAQLLPSPAVKAVLFTGSTVTAQTINRILAAREGAIIPLIAETGGLNAMIVDSSALLQQVINDVIVSAFGSAGQRCSALRVLYIQDSVYESFIAQLKGAMELLVIGSPELLSTDIGPVINNEALDNLKAHLSIWESNILYQCPYPEKSEGGYFMPPTLLAIDSIHCLNKEVFGPILHVIAYADTELTQVIADINATGYGLTLGIQSRITETIDFIQQRVHAGNCYVNRSMIGAVVGLQPFGGEGLSGTGPKAGGPHYLLRLCNERTLTVDTSAAGGNVDLLALE